MAMTDDQINQALAFAQLPYNAGNYTGQIITQLVEEVRAQRLLIPASTAAIDAQATVAAAADQAVDQTVLAPNNDGT